jgi:hypothetical protein
LPPPPKNYQEIVHHQYSLEFRAAIEKEYNTLLRKGLYREINSSNPASQADDMLHLMWVYTYKFNADGYLKSFKARLVARGGLQLTEEETYAATLAAQTFRAIIAIACTFDLEVRQFDVVAAYSHANLEQPLTAHLPEGFKQKGKCLQVSLLLLSWRALGEASEFWRDPGSKCRQPACTQSANLARQSDQHPSFPDSFVYLAASLGNSHTNS